MSTFISTGHFPVKPYVSILMTAYNAGSFLLDSVISIQNQSFKNWELVLIDNASTDGSIQNLDLSDKRIQLVSLPKNIGRTKALQLALLTSSGVFAAVLDADDIALPTRLERQLKLFQENSDLVLVGSQFEIFSSEYVHAKRTELISGYVTHDLLADTNPFCHSTIMFRIEHGLSVGGYRPEFQYAQDFDLVLRLATLGSCFILDESLISFRKHLGSLTSTPEVRLLRVRDEVRLFARAPKELQLSSNGFQINRRRQAMSQFECCYIELRNGNVIRASKALLASLKIDPLVSWIVPFIYRKFRTIKR